MDSQRFEDFNAVLLSQVTKFNISQYAYDIFFSSKADRFQKISRNWIRQFGSNSQHYMASKFHQWKDGDVSPNSSSRYKIIYSTLPTFTKEEKFVNAYFNIQTYVKNSYTKEVTVRELPNLYENLIAHIDNFSLKETSSYFTEVYNSEDFIKYQNTVKRIFKLFTGIIFSNLAEDITLVKDFQEKINSSFSETFFKTYLYEIKVDTQSMKTEDYIVPQIGELNTRMDELWHKDLQELSLIRISEIKKASEIMQIDGVLSCQQIENFISKRDKIMTAGNGGEMKLVLKTKAGILNINVKVLSQVEKSLIIFRFIMTVVLIILLLIFCVYFWDAAGWAVIAFFVVITFVPPDMGDFKKLVFN